VEYTENPDCMSHYTLPEIVKLQFHSGELTLEQLWLRAQQDLGADKVTLEFSREIIQKLTCPHCGHEEDLFVPVGSVSYEAGRCPNDGHMRAVAALHAYAGDEAFGQRKLSELGLPRFDIYTARSNSREIGYLVEGDAGAVLGALARGGT
jgi:hypothetical protein